jgi:hypothetical protein
MKVDLQIFSDVLLNLKPNLIYEMFYKPLCLALKLLLAYSREMEVVHHDHEAIRGWEGICDLVNLKISSILSSHHQ